MPYPALDREAARGWWKDWLSDLEGADDPQNVSIPEPPGCEWKEAGGEFQWGALVEKLVNQLREDFHSASSTSKFEADAAEILHSQLPEDVALADPEFWYWFAVSQGAGLVVERYRPTVKNPIPDIDNFASGNGRETLFYRLWIRGQLGHDPSREDPYELARYGDVDFWRSHVFRQMFLESPALLAGFVKFQFPDGPAGGGRLKGKNQKDLRALVKELRRVFANIEVGLMTESRAREFIEEQWTKIAPSVEAA